MFSGLPPQQRIDAPAAVNPVVDPTAVKGSQHVNAMSREQRNALKRRIHAQHPHLVSELRGEDMADPEA